MSKMKADPISAYSVHTNLTWCELLWSIAGPPCRG